MLASSSDDLNFEGYEQETWVRVQNYQKDDWLRIVDLWQAYNLHLAVIVDRLAPEALSKDRTDHCLDRIAWKPIPKDEPATLDYFIRDYVGHLEHHLSQIMPDYQPVMMGTYEYAGQNQEQ